jgi:hypothetical protein
MGAAWLRPLVACLGPARLRSSCRRLLFRSGKKMVPLVVGVVGFVGIPGSSEQISLPGDGAALHMNAIDEAMFEVGSAPVAAPDKAAALRQLSQESEITFPAGLAAHHTHDVTGQAIVMNTHGAKFCGAAVEKRLLAILAAIRLVDHDFNSHLLGGRDQAFHQLSHHRFQQGRVANADDRTKPRIELPKAL